ncbi:MAG: polyprenyl synthetase family protein [Elusimicrobia bacterium]|nr:polyprenyl synthetase family protein [Elusimicrobiota bacterium]
MPLKALETFGDRLGVAFQIVDDILDIEGDEAVVGKTLHTDLIHGKMTLPLIDYASGLSTDSARRAFHDFSEAPTAASTPLSLTFAGPASSIAPREKSNPY